MILSKSLKENKLFDIILDNIKHSKCLFSSNLLKKNNRIYINSKFQGMHIPLDWQAYSLMRAKVKLIISSGPNLHSQSNIFNTRQSYGNPTVQKIFSSILGNQKQNVMVISKKYQHQYFKSFVNPNFYNLIETPKFKNYHQLLQQLHNQKNTPILSECGLTFMNQYFNEVQKGKINRFDTIMLSYFQSQLPQIYYGLEFQLPLQKYYEKIWESELFESLTYPDHGKGKLTFEIYSKLK